MRQASCPSFRRGPWTQQRRLQKQWNFAMWVWGMGAALRCLSLHNAGLFFPSIAHSARGEKKREILIYLKFNQQNCPRVF